MDIDTLSLKSAKLTSCSQKNGDLRHFKHASGCGDWLIA